MPQETLVKYAWMPVRDRKVLFARSKDQELFYCPGGKPYPWEDDHTALMREVWEETGVLLERRSINWLNTFVGPGHGKAAGKLTVMPVYDAQCFGEPKPCNEVVELAWFTTADKHRTTVIGVDILDWFAVRDRID